MNNYLHQQLNLETGDVVEVSLDHAANVQLLDPANFEFYKSGQAFKYHGGYATVTPFRIPAPSPGSWHLVVDLGGGPGSVRAAVAVSSHSPAA